VHRDLPEPYAEQRRAVAVIRPATGADVPALARVQVRAWLHAYSGFLDPEQIAARPVEVREPQWRTALTDPDDPAVTVVWDQGGTVAGFTVTGPARDEDLDDAWGEVYALYVDPPAQGAGVGARLLADAHERLAAAGCTRASLWTFTANDQAIAFYERFGWRRDEAAPPHPEHWMAPSVRLRRDLP
jgi:GNAT superfamily N-acetyltransferase